MIPKRGTTQVVDDIVRHSQKWERHLTNVITESLNSLYGATANVYFLYYIMEMAEAITTSGQLSLKWAANWINNWLNKILKTEGADYVLYADTDSIYLDLEPLIIEIFGTSDISREEGETFLDDFCRKKIEPQLDKAYAELAETMGAHSNRMKMKREKICDRAVFTSGKKRYIMNVLNSEGVHYTEPKISATGVEAVKSSTPEICRDKMKESYNIIMNKDEAAVQEFIADFRQEFYKLPPEVIARNSSANDIGKYIDKNATYKSGTPQHIRGAILYNKALKDFGLDDRFDKIVSGDKVKIIYLNLPNPIRENAIAFPGVLPKELGLEKYIDYETQFEKVFLKPLASLLDDIGWKSEQISTLDQFFV